MNLKNLAKYSFRFFLLQGILTAFTIFYFDNFLCVDFHLLSLIKTIFNIFHNFPQIKIAFLCQMKNELILKMTTLIEIIQKFSRIQSTNFSFLFSYFYVLGNGMNNNWFIC